MKSFALDLMPSFVERVNGPEDFEKFKNKAKKFGLPMMLFFSEDRRISNEMKYLSVEFRKLSEGMCFTGLTCQNASCCSLFVSLLI